MKGFTMIELLLTIAMVVILIGITIPFFSQFSKNNLQIDSEMVVDSIRTAKLSAISQKNNSGWGVHFQSEKITIFKGISFEMREISFDEEIDISDNYIFSGVNDIFFSPFNGIPNKTGVIVMENQNGTKKEFMIDKRGEIIY
ncbi:MAG: prepilin-type N-terminal cleavage/methylation domain-containing protein [Candidatus Pacebacteria bacterium]|nr:prepilin-type N-terminal cleavage/methylation domain-containing protein [Candidatus Paceibacterota bacterium]